MYIASILKNIIYREPAFIFKYYLHKHSVVEESSVIFMADGKMAHGGLFDRLKGAISIYALSKVHGKRFVIEFTDPFLLENYLEPNRYDWRQKNCEVFYSFPHSKPVIAYSELFHPGRLMRARRGQAHFYFGGDILREINKKFGTAFEWTLLFEELFRPTVYLKKHVELVKKEIAKDYYCIHFRFQNLLGDKVESQRCIVLGDEEKRGLVASCLKEIRRIVSMQPVDMKAVLFSDSMLFLDIVRKELPKIYIVSGNVKHIDTAQDTSDDENLKVFTDVYLMAGGQKVFSAVGKGLYPSAFPEYSAKIGKRPFERIKLSAEA